mgnify:CR=1 FL=1
MYVMDGIGQSKKEQLTPRIGSCGRGSIQSRKFIIIIRVLYLFRFGQNSNDLMGGR